MLDWRFLLAALLAVPVQLHTARWYVRERSPLYAGQRVAAGAQQQQLLDTIGGAAHRARVPAGGRAPGAVTAALLAAVRADAARRSGW